MATADTDYNPAIRKEVKADADTGRTFKKYKHRAQGAAIGSAGTVAAILARKPLARAGRAVLRKFSATHLDDGDSDSDTFTGSVKKGAGLAAGAGAAYGAYKGVKAGAKAIGNSAVYTAAKKKAAGLIGKAGLVGSFLSMGEILGVTEFEYVGGYDQGKKTGGVGGHFNRNAGKYIGIVGGPVGIGVGAIVDHARKKSNKTISKLAPSTKSDMAAILEGTTDFSLGGFQEMLESSVRLKKAHLRTFKKMTPDQRSKQQHEMRIHRDALNDIQTASDRSGGGYSPSYYSAKQATTDFGSGDVMNCSHPKDLAMDPATLKRKKLNAGQTGPQSPLEPQDPIKKLTGMDGKMRFERLDPRISFASDSNGKLHSGSGEFEPEGGQITPQSIQRAYSAKDRLTGRPPAAVRTSIKRSIMKRALARVGQLTEL